MLFASIGTTGPNLISIIIVQKTSACPSYFPLADMERIKADGVNIIAPPIWMILNTDGDRKIVPSDYANYAKAAGLKLITWTLERDGPLKNGGGWYHQTISDVINSDGDTFEVLDALAKDVGVIGVFSDWPATVTYMRIVWIFN